MDMPETPDEMDEAQEPVGFDGEPIGGGDIRELAVNAGEQPPVATPQQQPRQQPAAALADHPDYLKHRREGETPDQTFSRLYAEQRDFATRQWHDSKELRAQVANLNGMLEPLLRQQYQAAQAQYYQEQAALIPDPETQPAEFAAYMAALNWDQQQQVYQYQQLQNDEAARLQAETQQYQQTFFPIMQEMEQLAQAQDPDVGQFMGLTLEMARQEFPDAPQELLVEYAGNQVLLEARGWRQQGIGVGDGIHRRMDVFRRAMGGSPAPARRGGAAAGSPTGQRLAKDSAAARRAQAVAPLSPGSGGGQSGAGDFNPAGMSEDDYVKQGLLMARKGQDLSQLAAQRLATREKRFQE